MEKLTETGNGPKIAWISRGMTLKRRLAFFIATVGGVGHAPIAPGTAGSFVGAILFIGLGRSTWTIQLTAVFAVLMAGLWSARDMERVTGIHDDRRIVIDEVVGVWITLLAFEPSVLWIILGFLVFRLLDIFKPFPANWIDQRWPGARGVMFDDVVSGIYAHLVLLAVARFGSLL